jgi:CBS domain-containing protein
MSIAEFCQSDVAVVEKNSSVFIAARKMREAHVGDVVVCEKENGVARPIGILTDRDIVVGVVALEIPLETVRVEDVMTPTLVTVSRDAGIYETLHLMETYGVRRLPVVDEAGGLIGIISSGDLLELLGTEILALSRLSAKQKLKEQEIRL